MQITQTAGVRGNQSIPELHYGTGMMPGDYVTNTRIKIPPGNTKPTLIQSKSTFIALYLSGTPQLASGDFLCLQCSNQGTAKYLTAPLKSRSKGR